MIKHPNKITIQSITGRHWQEEQADNDKHNPLSDYAYPTVFVNISLSSLTWHGGSGMVAGSLAV